MATKIYLGYPPENIVDWIKAEAERKQREKLKEPLCFTSEDGNTVVCLNNPVGSGNITSDGREINVVTSTDKQNWTPYEIGSEITLENIGDKVYFRAADGVENWTFNGFNFHVYGHVAASGNLNTLLKADGYVLDFSTVKDGADRSACYSSLFADCEYLTRAPELPATTLADNCYGSMFAGCTYLRQAPELPATTLANSCYNAMFYGCQYLTQAPELPATTLASYCYDGMFKGCTALASAPELPATTLANYCYSYMFSDCSSLTKAPKVLPATTLTEGCCANMFENCTNLTQAPEFLAAIADYFCCNYMFFNCISLMQAPKILPATTLDSYCYSSMFEGCMSLGQAPELPATTLAESCYSAMFMGCTSLAQAPELPATTLPIDCYQGMFSGCTFLAQASFPNLEKEIVSTDIVENQYTFTDAASNIEATCYDGILIINSTEA